MNLCHAFPVHELCCKDFGSAGFVKHFGHSEDCSLILDQIRKTFTAFCLPLIVALPCEFRLRIGDGFIEVEALREETTGGEKQRKVVEV